MSLEERYKKETGFSVGKIHDIGMHYCSNDYVEWLEGLVDSDCISDVIIWVTTETIPEEYASLNGIEMPYECRYACHREGDKYYCDQSGDQIKITHWEYATKPPE